MSQDNGTPVLNAARRLPASPSTPSHRIGGHSRSASILSSSSGVSIPSRSSSVIMSPAAVPVRSSSIISFPTKADGDLPLSASDLADTIASLRLADQDTASNGDNSNARTPQPGSHPFRPRPDAPALSPKSPFRKSLSKQKELSENSSSAPDEGLRRVTLIEISEEISDVNQAIGDIHTHIFSIQEKRHSGGDFHIVDQRSNASSSNDVTTQSELHASEVSPGPLSSANGLDLALMQLDEKLEAVSRSMQQLEVRFMETFPTHEDEEAGNTSIIDKEMGAWQRSARRGSFGSISSVSTFDDMMMPSFAPAMSPKALKAKYDVLAQAWTSLQEEAESLRKELADDKYLDVFRTVSEQAEGMMDSLDKAVSLCQAFVKQFKQDHQMGLVRRDPTHDVLGAEYDFDAKQDELASLTKTFSVKKSYYLPACQQVFNSLEKGTRDRQTSNGAILRRLADLKSRWRLLRDELMKTEKELKRAELLLRRAGSDSGSSSFTNEVTSPATSIASLPTVSSTLKTSASVQSGLGLGTPTRASALARTRPMSTALSSRISSGPSRLSSSSSVGSNLSNTPPSLPEKSRLRRISATAESLGLRSQPFSTPPRSGNVKSFGAPRSEQVERSGRMMDTVPDVVGTPGLNRATYKSDRGGPTAAETGVLGKSLGRPLSTNGRAGNQAKAAAVSEFSSSPSRHPPSSFKASWLGLEVTNSPRSKTPQSLPPRAHSGSVPNALPITPVRPSSRTSGANEAFPVTGRSFPSRASEAGGDDSVEYVESVPSRPGSSMGQYYRPPSAQGNVGDAKARKRDSMIPRLSVRSADYGQSPNRPGSALSQASSSTPIRYTGASRLSMQTPEPTIVARAQRLSMYARAPSTGLAGTPTHAGTPSKRPSRPPTSRRNPALSSGRATPLSAAALASLPTAEPGSSLNRSSIPNLRALRSGRTTPTFSDNGSIGGMSSGTWAGGFRATSHRVASSTVAGSSYGPTGPIEQYKANPNDALDLEIAAICNGLGVAVERLDPPLPRGVRLEEGTGKDNRARYELGGKVVACRLLELHRPAGSAGARAGTKARKILVRVGGGWQDLEQWLLARMSSI